MNFDQFPAMMMQAIAGGLMNVVRLQALLIGVEVAVVLLMLWLIDRV